LFAALVLESGFAEYDAMKLPALLTFVSVLALERPLVIVHSNARNGARLCNLGGNHIFHPKAALQTEGVCQASAFVE
jgi:hypothetical protein